MAYKSKHPLYRRWGRMHQRCKSPKDKDFRWYGAKGITVCKEWEDFWTFVKDVGTPPSTKHSIDRIDGTKGYSKENVRWATQKEQIQNSRAMFTCINGHPWTKETSRPIIKSNGRKSKACRVCMKIYDRNRYLMKKAKNKIW